MMGDDPKSIAMLIMKKKHGKGQEGGKPSMEESDDDMEGEGGGEGPDALKDMHRMMRSGDYSGAFDALRMAVSACQDDEY